VVKWREERERERERDVPLLLSSTSTSPRERAAREQREGEPLSHEEALLLAQSFLDLPCV